MYAIELETVELKSLMINISSSLVSLPIVFIVYDLYKKALLYKSSKLISQVVDKEINNIFLKFIYFTTHFFTEFHPQNDYDAYNLDNELKKSRKEIFKDVSSNSHHGYFIFSIFDDFHRDIDSVINRQRIGRSIDIKELSILQEFINNYVELKSCFNWITSNDFIKYSKLSNVQLVESKFTKSTDSDEIFYDVIYKGKDGKNITYYAAKYWLFDQDALTYCYKFSGNKAMEISHLLFKLYSSINKWKKIKNIDELTFDHAIISAHRLSLDDNITYNEHMEKNISIHGEF